MRRFAVSLVVALSVLMGRADGAPRAAFAPGSLTPRPPALDAAIPAEPKLTSGERSLVQWCMLRYGHGEYDYRLEKVEHRAEAAAKRYFDRWSRDELEATLVPLRKKLYRGTRAYTSVAFVLAYYGVDPDANGVRVAESVELQRHPPALLMSATGKRDVQGGAGVDNVGTAIDTLYRRHRSTPALRTYLAAPTDGCIGEEQSDVIGRLFIAYPADVLRAADTADGQRVLADCIAEGGGDWKRHDKRARYAGVWRAWRRAAASKDPAVVKRARTMKPLIAQAIGRG